MSEQKYIMADELGICHCNPAVFNDPERANGWNELLKIVQSAPTYTPAEIMAQQWVPVTERLPEMAQKVLIFWVANAEPCIDTALRLRDGWTATHWEISADVTHWMALPHPPKEANP